MKFFRNPYLALVFRVVIGIVFIYAALPKIADPFSFSVTIRNYQMIWPGITNLIAIILPWLELYTGLFLITGFYIRESSHILAVLTAGFIIALSSALIRGLDIGCGCFSAADQTEKINLLKIAEDVVFLMMILQIALVKNHVFTIGRFFSRTRPSR